MAGKLTLASILALFATGASAASIELIDVPGATFTAPTAVDSQGNVFGYWFDLDFLAHGFVRTPGGHIQTFNAPGLINVATSGADPRGDLAGHYEIHSHWNGFVRTYKGNTRVFESRKGNTFLEAVDERHGVVGHHYNNGHIHGFWARWNGKMKTIDAPGATDTYLTALTSDGTIAGTFNTGSQVAPMGAGFIRHPDRSVTTFSVGDAPWTSVTGMNDAGTIVGHYTGSDSIGHCFVRAADGTITSFDPEGSTSARPAAINATGAVTGSYDDTPSTRRGFVRAADGGMESFAVPDAVWTLPRAINDSGVVAGEWTTSTGARHGFVRTP